MSPKGKDIMINGVYVDVSTLTLKICLMLTDAVAGTLGAGLDLY